MANWNLSVDLRGNGANLNRSLRAAARNARALGRELRDATSDLDVTIHVGLDDTGLAAATRAAARALRSVEDEAQGASRALDALAGHAREAASQLGDLRTQAMAASAGLRTVGRSAQRADERLDGIGGRVRALRGDMDDLDGSTRRVGEGLRGLRGRVGGVGSSSRQAEGQVQDLRSVLISLAPALLPAAAAATPLAAALAAAGTGVAAMGAALGWQIKLLTDAADAQTKYDDAVRLHGATSQQAMAAEADMVSQYAAMPPATREAAAALSALTDEYKSWSGSLASSTMPAATQGFVTLSAILPKLTPLARGAGSELDRLVTVLSGEVATPGFDRFIDRLTGLSNRTLHEIVTEIIQLSQAAINFQRSDAFSQFMDYARQNGPLVADTLKNLALALVHLVGSSGDAGVSILTVANALAKLVNAIPAPFLGILVQAYTGMKLFALGANLVTAATGADAAAGVARFVRAARFGGVASATTGVVQGMGAMSKATGIAALAFAAFYAGQAIGEAFWAKTPVSAEHVAAAIAKMGDAGRMAAPDIKTLADSAARLKQTSVADTIYDYGTFHANQEWKKASGDFEAWDKQLTQLVGSGNMTAAKNTFDQISEALRKQGLSGKDIKSLFPEYQKALAGAKVEAKLTAEAMGLFGDQAQSTADKLAAQKASADGLRQSIQALNDAQRAGLGGMIGFEAAIDAAAKAARDNAGALSMTHGQLNLNSERARNAATALQDLATKTDEAAASARQSGSSWETVNGIYTRGRSELIKSAQAMGLSKSQAELLASSILHIPSKHSTQIEMRREDAIAGLNAVIAKIKATPNAKSVTVRALTKDAISMLESLGYKVKRLPNGRFKVTALTGSAYSNIRALQAARDRLHDKSVTFTVTKRTIFETVRRSGGSNQAAKNAAETFRARGGPVPGYASGGNVQMYPDGGYVQGPGTATSDSILAAFGSGSMARISNTEYVVRSAAVSKYGLPFFDAVNSGRFPRFAGGGSIPRLADGGSVTDWRYDPTTGSLYSTSDAGQAGHKTKKVKYKKHGKTYTKQVDYFSLGAVESKIKSAAKATKAWNKDLEKVADRAGGDVAEALAAMGKDGMKLAHKMATGSTKYINEMSKALKDLQKTAKASLTDYTRQLSKANQLDATFAKNLAKLAAGGYGDLAKQLAAQNDQSAMDLAAAAVKSPKKAKSANAAAKTANQALTADQVQELVAIIAAISTSKTGIHDVAAKTGLGEDEIIAVASKAKSQIKTSLGTRSTRFLTDLAHADAGLAYANGGIREGIYATRGGLLRFAEPSTGGEAYIPLAASKRGNATRVLSDVAGRFGLGLTDARAGRVVVVREQGPLIREQHWHVGGGRGDMDLVREIDSRNSYQLRRLARGGMAAR